MRSARRSRPTTSPEPGGFRGAKILQIGEGTNEIQRTVIARLLGC
jgi:alkylation response protein AidB-like acyl-CoA dehydrogenase